MNPSDESESEMVQLKEENEKLKTVIVSLEKELDSLVPSYSLNSTNKHVILLYDLIQGLNTILN